VSERSEHLNERSEFSDQHVKVLATSESHQRLMVHR
jgi:hypothetical protein